MLIRNIWCVARNFREHAKELGNSVPSEPIFFLKAGSCALAPDETIHLPSFSSQIEYELELALQFNERLQIDRACLALDLTARDVQKKAKAEGLPWALSKSFAGSCPLGPFFPSTADLPDRFFELHVNGSLRQKGHRDEMIFKPRDLVAFLLQTFPVCPGDLLLTGTPSGVSVAKSGDRVVARVSGISEAIWTVRN